MKAHIENVNLSVTTRKNALPTSKAVAGRFRLSPEMDTASFVEEEDTKVICGEPKTKRLMVGRGYSVRYNPEEGTFIVRVAMKGDPLSVTKAEWNFEECISYIKRKIYG